MNRPAPDLHRQPAVGWRRSGLWGILVLLILSLLVMLGWLAARHASAQLQDRLEQDAVTAVTGVRSALLRNVQHLTGLSTRNAAQPDVWQQDAAQLLAAHRELLRLELRDADLAPMAHADSGWRAPVFARLGRNSSRAEFEMACTNARRHSEPSYSPSYFVPLDGGLGIQVMELCMWVPGTTGNGVFVMATYSLQDVLSEFAGKLLTGEQQASFTEPDGVRLALHGQVRRGAALQSASHLLDLPGATMLLRVDSGATRVALFPSFLTAMVAAMTLALGSVIALLVRDTRRRMRAERGLAEALAFRQAMEDSLVTGLRARDLEGRTTYVNPAFCQMVGLDEAQLLGAPLEAPYWPPEHAAQYLRRQRERLAGSTVAREGHESVFMRRDGLRFAVLIFEAPLLDARSRHTGWMSAIVDISEQRRIEELSRASQERLQATARLASVGEMASLLSHELNQPLAAIASYAAGSINLVRGAWREETRAMFEEALQHIAAQATRAGTVIKSVHEFVRRRDGRRAAVAPQSLLDAIMPLLNLQARKLGAQVVVLVEPGLSAVWCDRAMVEQVLLNLARNAMQSMDQPQFRVRELLLAVQASPLTGDGWIEFLVADQGSGIAPAVREKLFAPFFTTKAEGMGLGLSLCRTVVEQHGSTLSHAPNEPCGTVFRFTLAVATHAEPAVAQ